MTWRKHLKETTYALLFGGIMAIFTALLIAPSFSAQVYYGNITATQGSIIYNSATGEEDQAPLHLKVTEHWETQTLTMKIVSYEDPPQIDAWIEWWGMADFWHKETHHSTVELFTTSPQVLYVHVDQQFEYDDGEFHYVETLYVILHCYPDGSYTSTGGTY